jgi:hypothetical protein
MLLEGLCHIVNIGLHWTIVTTNCIIDFVNLPQHITKMRELLYVCKVYALYHSNANIT